MAAVETRRCDAVHPFEAFRRRSRQSGAHDRLWIRRDELSDAYGSEMGADQLRGRRVYDRFVRSTRRRSWPPAGASGRRGGEPISVIHPVVFTRMPAGRAFACARGDGDLSPFAGSIDSVGLVSPIRPAARIKPRSWTPPCDAGLRMVATDGAGLSHRKPHAVRAAAT